MMHSSPWKGKSLLVLDYSNMWNSRSKALNKAQLTQWRWFCLWNIERIFYYICQNCYFFEVSLFWKACGLQTIGGLNYAKVSLPFIMEVIDSKDLVMHLNCGPKNLKPTPLYILFKDFNIGKFVLMRPHDLVLVCLNITQSDVKDDENEFFKTLKVKWWAFQWRKGQT